METEPLLYMLCLIVSGLLSFLAIYFIIALSDLECDYMNASECCEKLNMWIIPRILGTAVLIGLHVLLKNWYLTAFNLLFISYLIYQRFSLSRSSLGVFDPTEIYNRGRVQICIRQTFFVVFWFLGNFLLNMYLGVLSVMKGGKDPGMAVLEAQGIPYDPDQ